MNTVAVENTVARPVQPLKVLPDNEITRAEAVAINSRAYTQTMRNMDFDMWRSSVLGFVGQLIEGMRIDPVEVHKAVYSPEYTKMLGVDYYEGREASEVALGVLGYMRHQAAEERE